MTPYVFCSGYRFGWVCSALLVLALFSACSLEPHFAVAQAAAENPAAELSPAESPPAELQSGESPPIYHTQVAAQTVATNTTALDGAALRPEVRAFIDGMVDRHGFDRSQLLRLFSQVQFRDDIIARMTRPAERVLVWHEYRNIFLDRPRIEGGVAFWQEHADTLARAEQVYGVPPEIIVAIIGVETRYGRITGRDVVMDALTTLAFDFPRRADFFRSELEHYLLLTREEQINPLSLKGSYAGAMGIAQFMPSSYRAYAIDFSGDGRRDLWNNPVDAIGSVASYLAEHGWQRDGWVTVDATLENAEASELTSNGLDRPQRSLRDWQAQGVRPQIAGLDATLAANLLAFEAQWGTWYQLTFNNFYVITRYNRSRLYAMAVYELAQAIRSAHSG